MALGAILRAERERRGLTEHQVADATHMMVQMVREFEEDDFHRITAPIYGRGFVKLYAGLLELNVAPLLKDFDELYSQRGRRPPAPPRVPLQRFGDTPGASLERVAPPAPEAGASTDSATTSPIRVPVPAGVRSAKPADRGASATPPPPPADLFGEPLPPAGRVSTPVEEESAPPPRQRVAGPVSGPRVTDPSARPESAGGFRVPELPAALAAAPGGASAVRPAATQRSVLDSASHRFNGKPYRPSVGQRVGLQLASAVGTVVKGVAVVVLGIGAGFRRVGALFARIAGASLRGVSTGSRRLSASAGGGARVVRNLPWNRILRIALPVVVAALAIWGAVVGLRACVRSPASDAPLPPELATTAVLERILPPPAGYAD